MDPMLQLARRFLATEKMFESESRADIVEKIECEIREIEKERAKAGANLNGSDGLQLTLWTSKDVIEKKRAKTGANPNGSDGLQLTLWASRDVRAQEILAHVLYRQPEKIARRLCELKPELCPEFVHYLVDEARDEWQSEKIGKGRSRKKELDELFKRHGYNVHGTTPLSWNSVW